MNFEFGIVKWFNPHKGYGFIKPKEHREREIFFHYTAIRGKQGFRLLHDGQSVYYSVDPISKKADRANFVAPYIS